MYIFCKNLQFVLCELQFLCYTTQTVNHGGICASILIEFSIIYFIILSTEG